MRDGQSPEAVADRYGVPVATVRSWGQRHDAPKTILAPTVDDDPPEDEDWAEEGGGEGPDVAELDRVDYLTQTIHELDEVITECRSAGSWTALRGLYAERSTHHAERLAVIRSEGSRLDLTADPVALARQLEAAGALIRMLCTELGVEVEG
jgi:hypothetical protein